MIFFGKKAVKKPEKVCVDCDKKTQKDLPSSSISSEGMACERTYKHVTECMAKHNGQISPCQNEWDAFKTCHAEGGHSDEHSL